MRRNEQIALFTKEIWHWFSRHKRVLPWRDLPDTDPTERAYKVLVSEIMLQQTQVPRVIIIYKRFLDQFPTLQSLAHASNKEVIIAWRGMGYNSRALRLRDAAKTITETFGGNFPQEMDELLSIKGIGHYTAAAVRNFAFNIPTPCIDTNIRRILHRVFVGPENPDGTWEKDDKYLLGIASEVLEVAVQSGETRDWHAALMDFGSLVQTKRNPKWNVCPLTARGMMKATANNFPALIQSTSASREPGRFVGSTYIPNRIFRGRVIDELRIEHSGLTLDQIGARISVDWEPHEHREWLKQVLEKLKKDLLITQNRKKFVLKD